MSLIILQLINVYAKVIYVEVVEKPLKQSLTPPYYLIRKLILDNSSKCQVTFIDNH